MAKPQGRAGSWFTCGFYLGLPCFHQADMHTCYIIYYMYIYIYIYIIYCVICSIAGHFVTRASGFLCIFFLFWLFYFVQLSSGGSGVDWEVDGSNPCSS